MQGIKRGDYFVSRKGVQAKVVNIKSDDYYHGDMMQIRLQILSGLNKDQKVWYDKKTLLSLFNHSDSFGWVLTDDSTNQYYKYINENQFLYREDRLVDPETGETYIYEALMDMDDYTEDDLEKGVEAYYKNLDEVKTIYGNDWKQIALECIFEQEVSSKNASDLFNESQPASDSAFLAKL